jgi:SAM-dependent methyltransferase
MVVRANKTLILDGRAVHDSETMEACYRERHLKYGWSSSALFYSKSGLHEKRLHQAEDILYNCLTSSDSFLDAGCGFGDLVPYLPPCKYHGVDIILNFIEEAL